VTTLRASDVVTGHFTGTVEDKVRPAVVVSSVIYHTHRSDVVICFLTRKSQAPIRRPITHCAIGKRQD